MAQPSRPSTLLSSGAIGSRGLPALRGYFERALATYPNLRLEPIAALAGVDSVALPYRSVKDREAIEVMELDARGQVHRTSADYTASPTKRTP